jgi:hypothetical protein
LADAALRKTNRYRELLIDCQSDAAGLDGAEMNRSIAATEIAASASSPPETSAGSLQIDGFWSLAAFIWLGLERNPHSLVEFSDSRSLNGRNVHEHVIAAGIRLDEAVALLGIVELHGTCLAHASSPGSPADD